MVKYCQNCGAEVENDAGFCTECGNPFTESSNKPAVISGNQSRVMIKNFVGENDNIIVLDEKGPFKVIEYEGT